MKRCDFEIPSDSPFTLQNIPFGVFSIPPQHEKRVGAAVGMFIVDLSVLEQRPSFRQRCFDLDNDDQMKPIFMNTTLRPFAKLGAATRKRVRQTLIDWLSDANSPLFEDGLFEQRVFVPMQDAKMHMPFKIGGFTDFMCSDVHIENCSRLAGATVPPSHYAMPLGYNGRASSVVIDSEPIHRPRGIIRSSETSGYSFLPSQQMDYEAELGFFVSRPIPQGSVITADQAEDHIFGFVPLNDWSARDIQFAEMIPLGPMNGKAFATSISPWVITLDTLQDAKSASTAADLCEGGSTKAIHLCHEDNKATWNIDLEVSVFRPNRNGTQRLITTTSNLRDLRWSPAQMLAHLASSGCGLATGDLIGTGTISSLGIDLSNRGLGCLFELTEGGRNLVGDCHDERLTWLEDGDEVVMTARQGGGGVVFGRLKSKLLGYQAT